MNLNGTRRIRANRRGGSSDPTRTTTLQNQFIRATNKRLNLIQKVLIESIKTNNAFGLKTNVEPGDQLVLSPYQFANLSDSQKLDTYDAYIGAVIGALFMTDTATGQPYTDKWSTEAFVRGQKRANAEWIKAGGVGAPVQAGGPLSLRTPLTDQINMANKRAKTAMDGDAVKLQNRLSYAFGAALTGNMTTAQAATGIREAVAVAKRQTKVTAKTEVVRSFNMGNVAQLETLGVEEVQVVAEWVTAGDRRVCPACRDMEGKVFPIDVIRELIPLHPGCRCVAVPDLNPRAKTTTKIPESAEKLLPNSAKPCGCGHHEEPEPVVGETGMRGPRGFDGMKGNTGDRGTRVTRAKPVSAAHAVTMAGSALEANAENEAKSVRSATLERTEGAAKSDLEECEGRKASPGSAELEGRSRIMNSGRTPTGLKRSGFRSRKAVTANGSQ